MRLCPRECKRMLQNYPKNQEPRSCRTLERILVPVDICVATNGLEARTKIPEESWGNLAFWFYWGTHSASQEFCDYIHALRVYIYILC